MKKYNTFFLLVAFLIVLFSVSCQKEYDTVTLGVRTQTVVSNDPKVYINTANTPCWHVGDSIMINYQTCAIASTSGTSAVISGVSSSDNYAAFYPAGIVLNSTITNNATNSEAEVHMQVPGIQYYSEDDFGNQIIEVPMGAVATGGATNLQFYNLCSVVRVVVNNPSTSSSNLSVGSIALTSSDTKLSGPCYAAINRGINNTFTRWSSSASYTVTLSSSGSNAMASIAPGSSKPFDIVVPPFSAGPSISFTIYTTDNQMYTASRTPSSGLPSNTIAFVSFEIGEDDLTPLGNVAYLVDGPTFNSYLPVGSSVTGVSFDYESNVSNGQRLDVPGTPVPIYGNLVDGVWTISTSASSIVANADCSQMFYNTQTSANGSASSYITSISFGDNFNTTNVTNMSQMFKNCLELRSLNLSGFNTSNVTNMNAMFMSCKSIRTITASQDFNTANVTDMGYMFYDCNRLGLASMNTLLGYFNTEKVTNMSFMFRGGLRLDNNLNLSTFNTEWSEDRQTLNLSNMFFNCSSLRSITFGSGFTASACTTMANMFSGCSSLSNLNLQYFNTIRVTDMSQMFYGCVALGTINLTPSRDGTDGFTTVNVTDMSGMFNMNGASTNALTSLDLSWFDTRNVTDMSRMFYGLAALTTLTLSTTDDVNSFNTSNVEDMSYMFSQCGSLTEIRIYNFSIGTGTETITNTSGMLNYPNNSSPCTIYCPSAARDAMQQDGTGYSSNRYSFNVDPTGW